MGLWLTAGSLRRAGLLSDSDARKLNHIVTLVTGVLVFASLPPEMARWSARLAVGTLLFLLLLACGLRALPVCDTVVSGYARSNDGTRQVFHIWVSWLASIAGLLLVDALFDDVWVTASAAMILGIADGVAEPIGTRWGKHRVVLVWPGGAIAAVRTTEGCAAVLVGGTVTAIACLTAAGIPWSHSLLAVAFGVGAVTMAVEACSPHGSDNFTIPLASSLVLAMGRASLA